MSIPWDLQEQWARLEDNYRARRTVQAQFVREVMALVARTVDVKAAEARQDAHEEARKPLDEARAKIRDLERDLERRAIRSRHLDERIEGLQGQIQGLKAAQREREALLHDEQNQGDEVRVKFNARDWTPALLEEAAYRIRLAGGHDHTPMALSSTSISAVVPNPHQVNLDLATREHGGTPKPLSMEPVEHDETPRRRLPASVEGLVGLGAVAVCFVAIVLLGKVAEVLWG